MSEKEIEDKELICASDSLQSFCVTRSGPTWFEIRRRDKAGPSHLLSVVGFQRLPGQASLLSQLPLWYVWAPSVLCAETAWKPACILKRRWICKNCEWNRSALFCLQKTNPLTGDRPCRGPSSTDGGRQDKGCVFCPESRKETPWPGNPFVPQNFRMLWFFWLWWSHPLGYTRHLGPSRGIQEDLCSGLNMLSPNSHVETRILIW